MLHGAMNSESVVVENVLSSTAAGWGSCNSVGEDEFDGTNPFIKVAMGMGSDSLYTSTVPEQLFSETEAPDDFTVAMTLTSDSFEDALNSQQLLNDTPDVFVGSDTNLFSVAANIEVDDELSMMNWKLGQPTLPSSCLHDLDLPENMYDPVLYEEDTFMNPIHPADFGESNTSVGSAGMMNLDESKLQLEVSQCDVGGKTKRRRTLSSVWSCLLCRKTSAYKKVMQRHMLNSHSVSDDFHVHCVTKSTENCLKRKRSRKPKELNASVDDPVKKPKILSESSCDNVCEAKELNALPEVEQPKEISSTSCDEVTESKELSACAEITKDNIVEITKDSSCDNIDESKELSPTGHVDSFIDTEVSVQSPKQSDDEQVCSDSKVSDVRIVLTPLDNLVSDLTYLSNHNRLKLLLQKMKEPANTEQVLHREAGDPTNVSDLIESEDLPPDVSKEEPVEDTEVADVTPADSHPESENKTSDKDSFERIVRNQPYVKLERLKTSESDRFCIHAGRIRWSVDVRVLARIVASFDDPTMVYTCHICCRRYKLKHKLEAHARFHAEMTSPCDKCTNPFSKYSFRHYLRNYCGGHLTKKCIRGYLLSVDEFERKLGCSKKPRRCSENLTDSKVNLPNNAIENALTLVSISCVRSQLKVWTSEQNAQSTSGTLQDDTVTPTRRKRDDGADNSVQTLNANSFPTKRRRKKRFACYDVVRFQLNTQSRRTKIANASNGIKIEENMATKDEEKVIPERNSQNNSMPGYQEETSPSRSLFTFAEKLQQNSTEGISNEDDDFKPPTHSRYAFRRSQIIGSATSQDETKTVQLLSRSVSTSGMLNLSPMLKTFKQIAVQAFKSAQPSSSEDSVDAAVPPVEPVKRKRGRPRKYPLATVMKENKSPQVQELNVPEGEQLSSKVGKNERASDYNSLKTLQTNGHLQIPLTDYEQNLSENDDSVVPIDELSSTIKSNLGESPEPSSDRTDEAKPTDNSINCRVTEVKLEQALASAVEDRRQPLTDDEITNKTNQLSSAYKSVKFTINGKKFPDDFFGLFNSTPNKRFSVVESDCKAFKKSRARTLIPMVEKVNVDSMNRSRTSTSENSDTVDDGPSLNSKNFPNDSARTEDVQPELVKEPIHSDDNEQSPTDLSPFDTNKIITCRFCHRETSGEQLRNHTSRVHASLRVPCMFCKRPQPLFHRHLENHLRCHLIDGTQRRPGLVNNLVQFLLREGTIPDAKMFGTYCCNDCTMVFSSQRAFDRHQTICMHDSSDLFPAN